jgi:ribosome recycling factor
MNFDQHKNRMSSSLEVLTKELSGIRSGKVNPSLLDPVKVLAYGNHVSLSQVGNINVVDSKMMTIQVWDQSLTKAVEKAIRDSSLGLSPIAEVSTIRVPIPSLTEERRKELSKAAAKYCEDAKISIRNIRKDAMEMIKKAEKDKEISEDDSHKKSDEVQKMTDDFVKKIDDLLTKKQKEIMTV